MLKAGDVVCLKSGGPAMTVFHLDDQGQAHVCWMDAGTFRGAEMPACCLEITYP